jgi:hypothetical protein
MGCTVRYTSASRDRRQKRDLVPVPKDRARRNVFAVDGRGGHDGERREERDLPPESGPELLDPAAFGELAQLLIATGGLAERGEVEETDPHVASL